LVNPDGAVRELQSAGAILPLANQSGSLFKPERSGPPVARSASCGSGLLSAEQLERRRCCPIAKHGLPGLAKRFRVSLLLTELRADWHLPYRLLVFCDVEFLRAKLAATAARDGRGRAGFAACQTEQEAAADAFILGIIQQLNRIRRQRKQPLQALKAFAAAELHQARVSPGRQLSPAPSAPRTGRPVFPGLATSACTPVQAMIAPIRRGIGRRASAAGASPKAAAGLAQTETATPPERRLLAEHPDMIVCGGGLLRSYFSHEAAGATDEAGSDAGNRSQQAGVLWSIEAGEFCPAMVTMRRTWRGTLRSLKLSSLQPLLPGQCLAFMFICCAKGSKHYLDQPDIRDRRVQSPAAACQCWACSPRASSAGTARLGSGVCGMCPARHLLEALPHQPVRAVLVQGSSRSEMSLPRLK
uniref:RibD_C domain-containing protein n=1 Tax=Macrostomum lignano TaxID=282301 RepID=A0A1I8FIW5_9PLAT